MRGLPFPKVCFLSLFIFFTFFTITTNLLAQDQSTLERQKAHVEGQIDQNNTRMNQIKESITSIGTQLTLNPSNMSPGYKTRKEAELAKEHTRFKESQSQKADLESQLSVINYKLNRATITNAQQASIQQNDNTSTVIINMPATEMTPEQEAEARKGSRTLTQEQQQAINSCDSSYGFVGKTACNASLFSPITLGLLTAFNKADTTGDILAACKKAKDLNNISAIINTGAFALCLNSLRGCISNCNTAAQIDPTAQQKSEECSSKRNQILFISGPALFENIRRALTSPDCPEDTGIGPDGTAGTPGTNDDPFCHQLETELEDCRRRTHSARHSECREIDRQLLECRTGQQEQVACADKTGDELQECLALNKVEGPGGVGVGSAPGDRKANDNPFDDAIANPNFNPDDLLEGLDTITGEEDIPIDTEVYTGNDDDGFGFNGNPAPLAPAANPGGVGGLGGGGIGGFLGSTGGEGEEEDQGPYEEDVDPGIDTDILGDVSNARGGGSGFGSGGGQGAGQGFNLKGKNFKDFTLPKNLFGSKKANKAGRNMAGINEITSANGLSNFQKVSRAMNERRQTVFNK